MMYVCVLSVYSVPKNEAILEPAQKALTVFHHRK